MKVKIPWSDVFLYDLDAFRLQSEKVIVDGDENAVILINPKPSLLENLRKNGVKFYVED